MTHKQDVNVTESIVDLNATYLKEPIPITEQKWPIGTKPLVTTRTFTYNHEHYIRDCIEGILMQETTFPVQVLIHDDASTDRTPEIIKEYVAKYPHLITLYEQPENCYNKPNKYELRQPFYDLEKGCYIALCEGDDYWIDKYKLYKQVDEIENNNNINICFTAGYKYYERYNKIEPAYNYSSECKQFSITDVILGGGDFMPTASLLIRRNVYKSLPKWITEAPVGDYYIQILSSIPNGAIYVPIKTIIYRKGININSWSNTLYKNKDNVLTWVNRHIETLDKLDAYTNECYANEISYIKDKYYKKLIKSTKVDFSTKRYVFKNQMKDKKLVNHYLINTNAILLLIKVLRHVKISVGVFVSNIYKR